MYIIIAGGGLIGKGLAEKLVAAKHDVVVIDTDSENCEDIYGRLGAITIVGDATNIETLENAQIENCDVAVGVMPNDSDNLTFSVLAKHFKVDQILVRMHESQYEPVYKSIGVANIARTTDLLIDQLIVSIESSEIRKVIQLGNLEICILNVPEKSVLEGKTISDIFHLDGFPREVTVTCIYSDEAESYIPPTGTTVIHAHDRLFLCGSHSNIKKVAKRISKV